MLLVLDAKWLSLSLWHSFRFLTKSGAAVLKFLILGVRMDSHLGRLPVCRFRRIRAIG